MATITLSANRAEQYPGGIRIRYDLASVLAKKTVWVTTVAEAEKELDQFAVEVQKTVEPIADFPGAQVTASWPANMRKPRGWDAAYQDKRLRRYVELAAKAVTA